MWQKFNTLTLQARILSLAILAGDNTLHLHRTLRIKQNIAVATQAAATQAADSTQQMKYFICLISSISRSAPLGGAIYTIMETKI